MMRTFMALLITLAFAAQAAALGFSDVSSAPDGKSANITWTTSVECPTQLVYGLTDAYGKTKSESTKKTSHSLSLTALEPYTVYHYMLRCKVNNSFTANSTDYSLKTLEVLPDLLMVKLIATPQSAAADK